MPTQPLDVYDPQSVKAYLDQAKKRITEIGTAIIQGDLDDYELIDALDGVYDSLVWKEPQR